MRRPLRHLPAAVLAMAVAGCGASAQPTPPRTVAASPGPAPAAVPSPPAAPTTVPRPRPGETLGAQLTRPTALRATPGGRTIARLSRRTSFGSPRVLAVVSHRGAWLRVLSSALPNGRSGWIHAADATLLREVWSIEIDLSARRLVLSHRGRPYRRMTVGIGRASAPTPTGLFGVTDSLRAATPALGYGCCVLALTGRQPDVPQDWEGGDRLAIHGTNRPATIGAPASLGCIHVGDADLRLLMERIPLGTQVRIHA